MYYVYDSNCQLFVKSTKKPVCYTPFKALAKSFRSKLAATYWAKKTGSKVYE